MLFRIKEMRIIETATPYTDSLWSVSGQKADVIFPARRRWIHVDHLLEWVSVPAPAPAFWDSGLPDLMPRRRRYGMRYLTHYFELGCSKRFMMREVEV